MVNVKIVRNVNVHPDGQERIVKRIFASVSQKKTNFNLIPDFEHKNWFQVTVKWAVGVCTITVRPMDSSVGAKIRIKVGEKSSKSLQQFSHFSPKKSPISQNKTWINYRNPSYEFLEWSLRDWKMMLLSRKGFSDKRFRISVYRSENQIAQWAP